MKKHPFIRALYYDRLHEFDGKFPHHEKAEIDAMSNKELRQFGKNNSLVTVSADNSYTSTFIFNNNGVSVSIPVPDMPLVYLRLAYVNLKSLQEAKTILFKDSEKPETSLESAYNYLGAATIGIVNIYASIESFCNQIIPKNIEYPKKGKILNYDSVVYETTIDKIRYVLPLCLRKSFKTVNINAYNYLTDIVKLRDEIIHMKYDGKVNDQIELFKKMLEIDYTRLYNATVSLFNLYKPNYVVECSCPNDF